MNSKIEAALNGQIKTEAESSQVYLAMAIWAECNGYEGTSGFLYKHADEERMHMLKLVKFINERGGMAIVPQLDKPKSNYGSLEEVFQELFQHETNVTNEINKIVHLCLQENDYTTHNFLQWYVNEQLEEEALARTILDKLKLIQGNASGLYMFDRDITSYSVQSEANSKV
tara:strand:+ start:96 stop:608 length:513 start_codon:yes stop_codon:yes gene_type:complete